MKKHTAQLLAVALAYIGISAAWAGDDGSYTAAPDDLVWKDAKALPQGAKVAMMEGDLSKAEPFTFRVKYPANFDIPSHWHTAIEHVTVIIGSFHFAEGDKLDRSKVTSIPVGGYYYIGAKHNHYAWTSEETIIQVHGVGPWSITYVDPADDPRNKKK